MSGTILVVNGSPRKNGNCKFLIKKLAEGVFEKEPTAAMEVVDVAHLDIKPCKACDACRTEKRKGLYCVMPDGMAGLYNKILDSRALVFVSPIYWFGVSAQMKAFIDRLYGLNLEKTSALSGKPVAFVLVYADKDPYISGATNALRSFEDMFRYMGAAVKGFAYGTAADPGDAERNPALCADVVELGRRLTG